jgi:hypothetical protein
MRGLTEDERALLNHISRWGSDGYPVRKSGSRWTWGPFLSVNGPPVLFRTKREAVASFEAFEEILLDANAGRI